MSTAQRSKSSNATKTQKSARSSPERAEVASPTNAQATPTSQPDTLRTLRFARCTKAARWTTGAMVGVTKIGRRNANYWIKAVAEGGEDYYTKPGEAPGEWIGELAAELGLSGQVDRDAYAAVLAGKDPQSGDGLVTPSRAPQLHRRRRARAPPRPDPRLRHPLRRAEVGLAALCGRLTRGAGGDPSRPRPRRRRGGRLPRATRLLRPARQGRRRDRAGLRLPVDGLPPPLLARRRPRPPHPPRHRQHDPRRLRRALAQPRQPAAPVATSTRGESRRPRLPGGACAPR